MYSLPMANSLDYWRFAKDRSLYIGSGLLLMGTTLVYLSPYQPVERFSYENVSSSVTHNSVTDPSTQDKASEPVPSTQIETEFRIIDVALPIDTEYRESKQVAPGMSKVQEEGEKGVERRVIKITRVNGEISSEQISHQFLLTASKKRVVLRNSQPIVANNSTEKRIDMSQLNVQKVMQMEATAYTYTGNRTATGLEPQEGMIAVDPRVIPLGTQVYVEGYGYAVAADTGGLIKGNIIDVFFPSLQRCVHWGRRPVTVYVLSGK